MSTTNPRPEELPVVVPVNKPLNLIPVGLKEAALDSPSFRATAVHFADQVDAVEKWLDGLARAAGKLSQECASIEGLCNSFIQHCQPPNQFSEATIDHDFTLLALRKLGEGAQAAWLNAIISIKNLQNTIVDPIKTFIANEIRPFKETRRQLDDARKVYDVVLSHYAGQAKKKEPSSLREDAFQVFESRKAYVKTSMDLCVLAPQLRCALDSLLIKLSSDQWNELETIHSGSTFKIDEYSNLMIRIRNWSQEMDEGEKSFRRELLIARKEIEDSLENAIRPSRDLDYYAVSTVPKLGAGPSAIQRPPGSSPPESSKQGWLFLRTLTGKPTRVNWVRRWFFVKNGLFGWLVQGARSGGVEESEKIGVLLCGIRPANQEDRRFCFEVRTKDTSIILQAETQVELGEWISVFEAAKQKAVEEPASTDLPVSGGGPSVDAAFAVSPPLAPELAARRLDGQITNIVEDNTAVPSLSVEGDPSAQFTSRTSFDIGALRSKAGEKEGESSRDHASRILQKLDLHRKSTASPQMTGNSAPFSTSGIGSLIASSHTAMPIGPSRSQTVNEDTLMESSNFSATMAPTSLANLPSQTNLTKVALKIGLDRGLGLGIVDGTGGMPSGLMANQWGSANYGHLSRLERGEVNMQNNKRGLLTPTGPQSRRSSDPTSALDLSESTNIPPLKDNARFSPRPSPLPSPGPSTTSHRKTISATDDSRQNSRIANSFADFPSYYPAPLRAHDAQFRTIFPNVSYKERVVLVFRASWSGDGTQELPGRVFATPNEIYFYSHHLGLVLVTSVSMENISAVTAESTSSHDYINLHVSERDGRDEKIILLKTFLDNPRLLQQRLNFLVANCNSEDDEPMGLEPVLGQLVDLEENHKPQTLAAADSWDEYTGVRRAAPRAQVPKLKVDRNLYSGGDSTALADGTEVTRLKLPSRPVKYTPLNVKATAAEKVLDVSAKALLHIMFGDRSAIFPTIYQERRAQSIIQHPWVKLDDRGHCRREFTYEVDSKRSLSSEAPAIIDLQTIDVANDHLCYVITDNKTPWHLPRSDDFRLITKIVLTHDAKSRSKLAIFTNANWTSEPRFAKGTIERRAMADLEMDAMNLVDVVADQVQKLGDSCNTRRAMDIFGHIGQATEAASITSTNLDFLNASLRRSVKSRSLLGLLVESAQSSALSAASVVGMSVIGIVKAIVETLSLHRLLVCVLLASFALHLWNTSSVASSWWRDRSAVKFMKRLGVGPNPTMSKAIYLKDLPLTYANSFNDTDQSYGSQCSQAFSQILTSTTPGSASSAMSYSFFTDRSSQTTVNHLSRTRNRLAIHRHDILIALRLLNRIERDSIQAEYESWLLDENAKCEQMGKMLARGKDDGQRKGNETERGVNGQDERKIREWHEGYCGSCKKDWDVVSSAGAGGWDG